MERANSSTEMVDLMKESGNLDICMDMEYLDILQEKLLIKDNGIKINSMVVVSCITKTQKVWIFSSIIETWDQLIIFGYHMKVNFMMIANKGKAFFISLMENTLKETFSKISLKEKELTTSLMELKLMANGKITISKRNFDIYWN